MAIVVRIVSADGKRAVMKSLPGLPAKIKVPAGAKVEVTEDGRTMSLAQYVNEHANRKDSNEVLDSSKVTLEPAETWEEAEAALGVMPGPPSTETDNGYFSTADERGETMGFETNALLIGGGLVAAAGGAALALGGGSSKPKDTVAPTAPAGLDLATADDNGVSSTDNNTSITTALTISGTAEAGSTVELFDGNTSLGTVEVGTTGTFSMDVNLAQGDHAVTARAKDVAGNVSAPATALVIRVDTTAPAVATDLNLADDDDTGASNTDNITSKTSGLTITGKTDAGATVELFDGTTSLGTATAGTDGTFTKDVNLAPGTHQITARTSDPAGNISANSAPLTIVVDQGTTFTLDLATDDDTGISNTDNITRNTSGLTFSGTTTPNATIELFDGTTSLGTVTSNASGVFTKDISLAEGAHQISAKVLGGTSASDVLNVTVDTTGPAALSVPNLADDDDTGISTTDNITSKSSGLTITGTVASIQTLEVFVDGVSVGVVGVSNTGSFAKDIDLTEGTHSVTLRGIDAAGNLGTESAALSITVDKTAPIAPTGLDLAEADDNGSSTADNITSITSGLTINGTAEAGSRIELFDGASSLGTATVDANGTFTKDISLALGSHAITARATDAAGNVGAASTVLTIQVVENAQLAASSFAAEDSSAALLSDIGASSTLDHLGLHDTSSSFG